VYVVHCLISKAHLIVGFFIAYRKVRRRMSDEQKLEKELQDKGLNAPRLTPEHIDSKIKAVRFINGDVVPDYFADDYKNDCGASCLTICILSLENGFTVTGESACVSPENFDEKIGREVAYKNAYEKIWQLEGYLLKEKLYQAKLDKNF